MRIPALILLLLAAPAVAGNDLVRPQPAGGNRKSALYRYGKQRVLVNRGSPRWRGLDHGKILRNEVRANVRAFLDEWAIGRMGRTRAELKAIWDRIAPHIPAHFHEELRGLADGSGVPLADLQLLHAIPSRYHCTGTAALPAVTRDRKVYHSRSLDYYLDIGDTVRPQTNSLLLIAVPDEGIPHAVVGWAGFIGAVTGINLEGVSIGEMGSRSSDESFDGFPMIFLVREALRTARNLQQVQDLWRKSPRTCGFNFIFCDTDETCAVECNRSTLRFFLPGDEREAVAPHSPIPGIVRRCNHFVDPELSKTQRTDYDPRLNIPFSFSAYKRQGQFLQSQSGRIDATTMVEMLQAYPPFATAMHQAVMCPNDRVIWVSQARDPATDPLPSAQYQDFYRYELRTLVLNRPQPARRIGAPAGVATGERAIQGYFAHEPEPFTWRLRKLRSLGKVTIHHLEFPSPGPSKTPENGTVHAEYYLPPGDGPFPCAVVLHILDGRFIVARMVASSLAQRGVAALMIQQPYYGYRRGRVDPSKADLADLVDALRQGVRDIRRGAAWLRTRKEIDSRRIGIAGVSLGSFTAQLAAGADGRFNRCAFVLGGGSLVDTIYNGSKDTRSIAQLLERRGWTRDRAREAMAPVEPLSVAAGVPRRGVLMINCKEDEVVPPASTRAYWKAIGEPEIVWYDGGHYALIRRVPELLKRLGDHFAQPAE
jgi:dienelactone hydrolase